MTSPSLHITRHDHQRLSVLVAAARTHPALDKLRGELTRATILDPIAPVPPTLVTMNSRVEFEDIGSGETETYTLVFPDEANITEGRLSVLAPIGTALLGFHAGDIVEWPTPGGLRRLRIRQVTPRPEAAPVAAPATAGR